MNRLLSVAVPLSIAVLAVPALAASERQDCAPPVLATLARQIHAEHFVPGPRDNGSDAAGVVVASTCKRMPGEPRLTLAAVAWETQKPDTKALAIAIVDESNGSIEALRRDEIGEDAATQVDPGSLRLDTAPYELAPGVRAFGLDVASEDRSCGEGGQGPSRTLYVREGRTLRPVLEGLAISQWWWLRGNQPRCDGDPKDAAAAIVEDYAVSIGLGAPGRSGWRDLVLTATSKRSDHKPGRKPLHVRVPYDGRVYDLKSFDKTYDDWRK